MNKLALLIVFSTVAVFGQSGAFAPSGGSQSLTINVTGGTAAVGTTPTLIVPVTVPLAPNTTNYIYVDLVSGIVTSNGTGFTSTVYPIATAVTNATQVVQLTDDRPGAFTVTGGGGAGTVTGATTGGGLVLTSTTLGLLTTCSSTQVLAWNGTAWACAASGAGSVTSVTGTANQIASTLGATPVLSLTSPLNPPGNVNMASGNVLGWNSDTGLSRPAANTVAVGNNTPGDASGTVRAANMTASAKVVIGTDSGAAGTCLGCLAQTEGITANMVPTVGATACGWDSTSHKQRCTINGAAVADVGGSMVYPPVNVIPTTAAGPAWGGGYYNAGTAAPRLTPIDTPGETVPTAIASSGNTIEYDGWTGMFPDGTYVIVDQFQPTWVSTVSSAQFRISTNQGNSWSAATIIKQGVSGGLTYNCCGGGITNTGRMIITYQLLNNAVIQGVYSSYSDDQGATWSTPVVVDSDTTQTVYGGMITIGGGAIMSSTYGGSTDHVQISTNNGVSWGTPITSISNAANSEASYVYLGGNTILAVVRGSTTGGRYLDQYISSDNGATWTLQGALPAAVGDSEGVSPWLSTYLDKGIRVVTLSYQVRSISQEQMVYGYAASLIASGPSAWLLDSTVVIGTFPFCGNNPATNGYSSDFHPYDSPAGFGRFYNFNTSGCPSTGGTSLVFYRTPATAQSPLDQYSKGKIAINTITPVYSFDDQALSTISGWVPGVNTNLGNYYIAGKSFLTWQNTNTNLFVGFNGTPPTPSGTGNTSVGRNAGFSLSGGAQNVTVGDNANSAVTSGSYNTAVGTGASAGLTGAHDTLIGRSAAVSAGADTYVIAIGDSALGNGSFTSTIGTPSQTKEAFILGVTSTGSTCRVTTAVPLTVSGTAVTVCSWTLPNASIAQSLAWNCNGTYTTTTAADTLSIGMNSSQDLTSETGNASINSTLVGTNTQGSVTSTSTGNQNILTGASVSSVTGTPWSSFGTVTKSLTASSAMTFSITATITGTSPSGQINAGSYCNLF